ncbi:MAG TPA: 16S rRNA (cytidine(1402)-2'-O)-methyltransferase [Vicinamibacterales bacterium]
MSGTLYVVATPIGNLEDITLRALRVLREVDAIAAEDTRRSARLLGHHGITTKTVSFHEHNARARVPQLISRLEAGESVAIITDAGTPGVSDPGLELVKEAIERGIRVDPVPGASAPLAALIASGFEMVPFTVFGFAPNKANARLKWLEEIARTPHTFSFFETPHRIQATLRQGAAVFGERPIILARELTKLHQEFLRGTSSELADRVSDARGEFTVLVGHAAKALRPSEMRLADEDVAREFWQITETGRTSRRQAVNEVAKRSGRSAKEVYSAIERAKKLGT